MNIVKHVELFSFAAVLILNAGISMAAPMSGHGAHEQMMSAAAVTNFADVEKHKGCRHCGMDRGKFAYSRMLINYSDGSIVGLCSIHCTVIELRANQDKIVKTVEVADLNTKILVDAEKATWVIGGNKNGVMTRTPKWAFVKKDDAAAFISKNGGRLASYKEAWYLAEKD